MDRSMNTDVRPMDKTLTILIAIAAFLGCVVILAAGYPQAVAKGESVFFADWRKHVIFLLGAVWVYFWVARFSMDFLKVIAKPAFYLTFIGLILVFIPPFGVKINEAWRWISVFGFTIQPSEFMKAAVILYLASVLSAPVLRSLPRPRDWVQTVDRRIIPFLQKSWPYVVVFIALVLIEREPDLGTSLMVGAAAFGVLLFSRIPTKVLLTCLGVGVLIALIIIMSGFERYRFERFIKHGDRWNPAVAKDIGFQPTHSELAMATGGATGVGVGKGRSKYIMPAATTDFIYTTAVEELGFFGSVSILVVLGAISLRLIMQAATIEDPFRRMIVGAVGWWIGVQSVLNMLMAGAALPTVGIPLPFFSYGGSSLFALAVTMGIAQAAIRGRVAQEAKRAVSRHRRGHRRTRLSRA